MKLEKLLSAGRCSDVAMELLAARGNSTNKGVLASVNYKTGGVMFFPFMWFCFWWHQKIGKAKQLLTVGKKDKGKENVIERADIGEGI